MLLHADCWLVEDWRCRSLPSSLCSRRIWTIQAANRRPSSCLLIELGPGWAIWDLCLLSVRLLCHEGVILEMQEEMSFYAGRVSFWGGRTRRWSRASLWPHFSSFSWSFLPSIPSCWNLGPGLQLLVFSEDGTASDPGRYSNCQYSR